MKQSEKQTLLDVSLERCIPNAFEAPEEAESYRGPAVIEAFVGDSRMGHVFLGRWEGDKIELLGSNAVLAAAQEAGVKALGTVIVEHISDEQWLLRSRYAILQPDVLQAYHLYQISKKLSIPLQWDSQQTEVLELMDKFRHEWAGLLPQPLSDSTLYVDEHGERRISTWSEALFTLRGLMERTANILKARARVGVGSSEDSPSPATGPSRRTKIQ